MDLTTAYQYISTHKPAMVYISGKSSTGKSTFARKLHSTEDYQVIELEAVLLDIIKNRGLDEQTTFKKVLHDTGDSAEKQYFLAATDQAISAASAAGVPLVIEGAVANTALLQRILQAATSPLFLYLHPANLQTYTRNLTQRFMESDETSYGGLSLAFWEQVDPKAFRTFCATRQLNDSITASIAAYARISQQESAGRLREYQRVFADIMVVEIT